MTNFDNMDVLMFTKTFFQVLTPVIGNRFIKKIMDTDDQLLFPDKIKLSPEANAVIQMKVFKPYLLNNMTKIHFNQNSDQEN